MYVPATLVGIVVTEPQRGFTRSDTTVANFGLSTKRKIRQGEGWTDTDITTWIIRAYGELAEQVLSTTTIGQGLVVTGSLAANSWRTPDGEQRTRIDMRALSIAPNMGEAAEPVRLVLRGTVSEPPELYTDGPVPVVETAVRTSRFKRGRVDQEVDVTHWPVTASGEMAERMLSWPMGADVVVMGEARPLPEADPDTPQVEVYASAAGMDLVAPDTTPTRGR